MDLKGYIGEATAYDKKLMLERKDPTSWLKSVSAFANTQGGRLLFGVANDGSLAGKQSVITLTAEVLAVLRESEKDGSASAERVAKILKLIPDGVRCHIKNLRALGRLMRVGNRRVGNWIVVDETLADVGLQSAKRKGGGK